MCIRDRFGTLVTWSNLQRLGERADDAAKTISRMFLSISPGRVKSAMEEVGTYLLPERFFHLARQMGRFLWDGRPGHPIIIRWWRPAFSMTVGSSTAMSIMGNHGGASDGTGIWGFLDTPSEIATAWNNITLWRKVLNRQDTLRSYHKESRLATNTITACLLYTSPSPRD